MQGPIERCPTENQIEVRFLGTHDALMKLRRIARTLKVKDISEWEFEEGEISDPGAFPSELTGNSGGASIRVGRGNEGLTQKQLAEMTGIAQHHISEMENGKRPIGKETAKKVAYVLHMDYRVFL
jgi:DNA-binding XRE family transcriptional regulator